ADAAGRALRPLREVAPRVADLVCPVPYEALQRSSDPLWAPAARNFFTSVYLRTLDAETIRVLVRAHAQTGSSRSEIHVHQLGGAVARVAEDETACVGRGAPYLVTVLARWLDPSESDEHIRWAEELHASLARSGTGRACVNFLGDERRDDVAEAYGEATLERLVALKNAYD